MNPNDPCSNCGEYHSCTDLISQQRDQIESLKKLVQLQYEDAVVQGHEIEALKSEVEELSVLCVEFNVPTKANGQVTWPVAWRGKEYDGVTIKFYYETERNKLPYRLYDSAVPLYDHPVELTDTVIDKEIEYATLQGYDSSYLEGFSDGFERARSILRGETK